MGVSTKATRGLAFPPYTAHSANSQLHVWGGVGMVGLVTHAWPPQAVTDRPGPAPRSSLLGYPGTLGWQKAPPLLDPK